MDPLADALTDALMAPFNSVPDRDGALHARMDWTGPSVWEQKWTIQDAAMLYYPRTIFCQGMHMSCEGCNKTATLG